MSQQKQPQYFYIGDKELKNIKQKNVSKKIKEKNQDLLNPLFNFDRSFGESLSKLTNIDIGKSQPFIQIELLDISRRSY